MLIKGCRATVKYRSELQADAVYTTIFLVREEKERRKEVAERRERLNAGKTAKRARDQTRVPSYDSA